MDPTVLTGDPPIPVVLRRSGRARRISLRVSQLDGRVTLTVPPGVSDREALAFAESKAAWVRRHLLAQDATLDVAPGMALPVEGVLRRVEPSDTSRVRLSRDVLALPLDRPGIRAQAFLKTLARDRLTAAADQYAATLGRPYARITLRDTRSRWGSCSSAGALMFSWRLVLAPPDVLTYVAAHEVAHLAEMNHSAAFWAHVTSLYGPHTAQRDWLRQNGAGLHRFRFDAAPSD